MRILTLLTVLAGLMLPAALLQAQQTPFLNHYAWNPRLFNPASQGGANGGEIALVYRNQFTQLEASVRPTSYLLHIDASAFLPERIGFAVQLLGDKAHLLNCFQLSGFFGYHLIQNNRIRLSLGAAIGYLNQNFDFDGVRVSNIQDLDIFDNRLNTGRFDGGPGLAFEYRLDNGSFFALDAAASQLFSSDITIRKSSATNANGVVYDMIPHLLTNGRFRIQAGGFALEPNVIFRALSGDRPLKAGVFDFNLNAYFLKNNRLMVGAGTRTSTGGFHLQVGVAPTVDTRINFSGELHPALGTTFEIGAGYTFSRRKENPDLLQGPYKEAKALSNGLDFRISSVKTQQDAIGNAISASASAESLKQRELASGQCAALLEQTEREINNMLPVVNSLEAKRLEAEKIMRNAEIESEKISEESRGNLAAIVELKRQATLNLDELGVRQRDLLQKCTALKPEINELACIQSGDDACVRELFSTRLNNLPGNPPDMFPIQTITTPGRTSLILRFPNDEEAYALTTGARNLATNIFTVIEEVKQQGLRLAWIDLVTELQEDESTIDYKPGLLYAGDLDNEITAYTLVDNKSGKSIERQFAPDNFTELSLEQIGALKLATLRSYFIKLGIPANQISLTVRFNHPENIYREETRTVVKISY